MAKWTKGMSVKSHWFILIYIEMYSKFSITRAPVKETHTELSCEDPPPVWKSSSYFCSSVSQLKA